MPPLTAAAKRKAAAIDRTFIFAAFKKAGRKLEIAAKRLRVPLRTLNTRIVALGLRDTLTKRYPPRTGPRPKRKKKWTAEIASPAGAPSADAPPRGPT